MNFELSLIIILIIMSGLLVLLQRIRLKRLAVYHSALLGKVEVVQSYNGEKMLTTNSFPQGISIEQESIRQSYWYKIAHQAFIHTQNIKNPQVLILGLGANTSSQLLAKLNPRVSQTIVEIDPQIIQANRDFFNLDKLPNLTLINADAHKVIKTRYEIRDTRYDCIIVDIFLSTPPYIDKKSNQLGFIKKLLPLLKRGGMVIFNRPSHNQEARDEGIELKKHLEKLFKKVEIFDIRDPRRYRNNVITASVVL